MNTSLSLLFYLKKPKVCTTGSFPIYLRITTNGLRAEVSSQRDCNPVKWNQKAGKALGNHEESKALNAYLDILRHKVHDAHKEMILRGEIVSAKALKSRVEGTNGSHHSLCKVFADHNAQVEALVGQEFASGTLERYRTSLKHTFDFLQWKFKVTDIDIRKINHAFITDYEFYLRSVRKCNNNSAVKYIKNFGKIIRICLANGWIEKNPFANYKAKVKEVVRVFLTEEELQILVNKTFTNERLQLVKDIFVFSCYTGLAYIDVKQLDHSNVSLGIDGGKWIFINRQKTDTSAHIPLLPPALAIMEKYKDHPQCLNESRLLPVLSNQKMNAYLKEIADLCGINKEFTYHTARHTFATTVTLSNGVPIESVSKMLGHKDIKITQHYAKILDKKVSDDMQVLRDKFNKLPEQINKTAG